MYDLSPIRKQDSHNICELYHQAFDQPMCNIDSQRLFLWFYFKNTYGKNYSRGIYDGTVFLSYWGFIPIDCIINGKKKKGALSFQLASSDNVLGTTLSLWKKIKKDLIKDEALISFTINHENSYPLLKALSWKSVPTPVLIQTYHPIKLVFDLLIDRLNVQVLTKIIRRLIMPLDSMISKIKSLFHSKSKNICFVDSFGSGYDDLVVSMNRYIKNGILLNYNYVTWRYINKPNNNYKILSYVEDGLDKGYLIYTTKKEYGTKLGYVMDIITNPDDKYVINDLINFAKIEMSQSGVTLVSALSFNDNIFYKHYRSNGFKKLPQIFFPHKSYFSLYNFLNLENSPKPGSWHISWGNHDNI